MTPEFHYDIEQTLPNGQANPAWLQLRCGRIGSTDAAALMANGEGRRKMIYRVASEIVTGIPTESYQNDYMRRGKEQEAEARAAFALRFGCEPKTIGYVTRGRIGTSPDSLIGKNRVLEIKSQRADLLAATLLADKFPTEHHAQTQWHLMVCERDKIDLAIYAPKMPLFHKQAGRDENYIRKLADAADRAWDEIDIIVRRLKGYM